MHENCMSKASAWSRFNCTLAKDVAIHLQYVECGRVAMHAYPIYQHTSLLTLLPFPPVKHPAMV